MGKNLPKYSFIYVTLYYFLPLSVFLDNHQDKAAEIEVENSARFTDLRAGLFLVDVSTAHTLSKGWSLLQWKKTLNFCSKCGSPLGKN